MSTMVLEVNNEQEKVLEGLLRYMDVSFQKISPNEDFLDILPTTTKKRIEKGLADTDAGRYTSAKEVLKEMLSK